MQLAENLTIRRCYRKLLFTNKQNRCRFRAIRIALARKIISANFRCFFFFFYLFFLFEGKRDSDIQKIIQKFDFADASLSL